jgi:hypothetical protein
MDEREKAIEQQRMESVARVWQKYPVEAIKMQSNHCPVCCFWIPAKIRSDRTHLSVDGKECSYGLAPVTSQGLPCPYQSFI